MNNDIIDPTSRATRPAVIDALTPTDTASLGALDQPATAAASAPASLPPPLKRHEHRRRTIVLVLLVATAVVGLIAYAATAGNRSAGQMDLVDAATRVPAQTISLDVAEKLGATVQETPRRLTVNGQVVVNDTLVLTPTAQPDQAVAGQLYYDQTTNQLGYYNGVGFIHLQGQGTGGTAGGADLNGAVGTIALFTGGGTVGNSLLRQSGSTVTVGGGLNVQGTYQVNGAQISSASLSNDANLAKLDGTQTFSGSNTFRGADATTVFSVQKAAGTPLFTVDSASNTIVLGNDGATPTAITVRGGAAVGNNVLGANLVFDAPNGTGVGGSGDFIFRTAAGVANPLITFDATTGTETTDSTTPISWTHVTTSLPDRFLIVSVGTQAPFPTVPAKSSSVSYNGVPLTRLADLTGLLANGSVWIMTNPPVGSHLVSVTFAGNLSGAGGQSTTFYNVDQATPIGAFTTQGVLGSSVITTLNGTNPGQVVFDAVMARQDIGLIAPGSGQAMLYRQLSFNVNAGSTKQGGPGSTTMTWAGPGSSSLNHVVLALNPQPNVTPDPLAERLRITQLGTLGVGLGSSENALFDLTFGGGSDRTIAINQQPTTGNGRSLTLRAGDAAIGGDNNGGNLLLQGGSANGAGIGGSVIVKPRTDSATGFQIQDSAGTAFFTADTSNLAITIAGTTASFGSLTITNAHVKSTQTTAPTIGTPSGCGTSPTAAMTAGSTDTAGSFTITAGTGAITGPCVVTLTFNKTYGAAPKSVTVTPTTAVGASPQGRTAVVSATTATTFTVTITPVNPAASELNAYYYWVVE